MQEALHNLKETVNSWNPDTVRLIATFVMILIAGIAAIITNYMINSKELRKKYLAVTDAAKQKLERGMQSSSVRIFNYAELDAYLKRTGVFYMSGGKLDPLGYLAIRFGAALFGLAVGTKFSIAIGLGFMVALFFLPDFIINESNKSDNNKMLEDIKNVYDTLRIQSKAGVYIADILSDCYTVVANRRLKDAFLKLSSDIMANNDLSLAMEKFQEMFTNQYLSTLAVIIEQSLRTGKSIKMFDDIKKQLEDIDITLMMQEKIRIQRKIAATQTMIYTSVVAASLFLAAVSLQSGMNF